MNYNVNLDVLVASAILVGLRVSGLMLFAPFFSNQSMPAQAKITLTVLLTILLYPLAPHPTTALTMSSMLSAVFGEFSVGLLMGVTVAAVFDAAQLAGYLLSVQMGFSLASMYDPTSQADTPVIAVFHQTIALLIFFRMGAPQMLIAALAHSFSYIPAGGVSLHGQAVQALMMQGTAIFYTGIQIAAPVLSATLLADLTLGFVGRASPQLPVMLIGMSVKTVLGLLVLIGALAFWPRLFSEHFAQAIGVGERILHLTQ